MQSTARGNYFFYWTGRGNYMRTCSWSWSWLLHFFRSGAATSYTLVYTVRHRAAHCHPSYVAAFFLFLTQGVKQCPSIVFFRRYVRSVKACLLRRLAAFIQHDVDRKAVQLLSNSVFFKTSLKQCIVGEERDIVPRICWAARFGVAGGPSIVRP
jgi:hypothetical protein